MEKGLGSCLNLKFLLKISKFKLFNFRGMGSPPEFRNEIFDLSFVSLNVDQKFTVQRRIKLKPTATQNGTF